MALIVRGHIVKKGDPKYHEKLLLFNGNVFDLEPDDFAYFIREKSREKIAKIKKEDEEAKRLFKCQSVVH